MLELEVYAAGLRPGQDPGARSSARRYSRSALQSRSQPQFGLSRARSIHVYFARDLRHFSQARARSAFHWRNSGRASSKNENAAAESENITANACSIF